VDQSNANSTEEVGPLPLARSSVLDVRSLRERMQLTQRQFAGWFGFSVATLRHWECGNRQPAGPALVLLSVIRENPRVVLRAVRKARMRGPGGLATIEPQELSRAPPGYGNRPPPLQRRGPRSR
jgi:putative transcriptional regulator